MLAQFSTSFSPRPRRWNVVTVGAEDTLVDVIGKHAHLAARGMIAIAGEKPAASRHVIH
jgi:hypothetical protein